MQNRLSKSLGNIYNGPMKNTHCWILDVVPIMPTNKRVVAVDISIEMIECARKLCRNDSITFEQLDIAGDFEECERKLAQKFDNITSFYCLHWIQNQR